MNNENIGSPLPSGPLATSPPGVHSECLTRGVVSIELMTNNPAKLRHLVQLGVPVERRLPAVVAANEFSAAYLEVKRKRMRHDLPRAGAPVTPGE
jgi:hypothetical protein